MATKTPESGKKWQTQQSKQSKPTNRQLQRLGHLEESGCHAILHLRFDLKESGFFDPVDEFDHVCVYYADAKVFHAPRRNTSPPPHDFQSHLD